MTILKTPALPRDVLFKGRENTTDVLAKTAKALESVPSVSGSGGQNKEPQNQEAIATVMYLADVMGRLLNKISELREGTLADFIARMEVYVSETAAALPEQTRKMFANRAEVYVNAVAAEIQSREEAEQQALNSENFLAFLESLEVAAIQAINLPPDIQTQTMATAVADYRHALEGGEAVGLLEPGSGALMLEDLRQDMALAAAEKNIADSAEPTYLALLIASGGTGLPEVDNLPEGTRAALLEKTINTDPEKEGTS